MLRDIRVHLKHWIVADGEIPPIAVGDVVELGLGVDAESPPIQTPSARPDGITPLESTPGDGARAHAAVCGRLVVARDSDHEAVGVIVSVDDAVDLIVLGYPTIDQSLELIDESLDGLRVLIHGDVVIEPYLWLPGVFRDAAPHGPARAQVERIRAISQTRKKGADEGDQFAIADVRVTDPHDIGQADYLVDLRFTAVGHQLDHERETN